MTISPDPDTGSDPIPDPVPDTNKFDTSDRAMILILAVLMMAGSALFYAYVARLGLLSFPAVGHNAGGSDWTYFLTALDFRERRLSLILTLRTFVTTLGFIVGLVLAAIGGIFVLRRATAPLSLNAVSSGDGAAPVMSTARGMTLSLATTSPGIVFALAGVAVIWLTQVLVLPVGAPEIFPGPAVPTCPIDQVVANTCSIDQAPGSGSQGTMLETYCALRPDDENCAALMLKLGEDS